MTGNANSGGKKAKPYREALTRLLMREEGDVPKGKNNLDRIVAIHLSKALEGDVPAIKDIADRLDGKPAQAIVGGDDDDNPVVIINRIERVLIDNSNHRDRESIQTIIAAEQI